MPSGAGEPVCALQRGEVVRLGEDLRLGQLEELLAEERQLLLGVRSG